MFSNIQYIVELLNVDTEYNRGCKYSNNSTKFKRTSASDTFITPRGVDLLVNNKMEGVRSNNCDQYCIYI